LQTLRWRETDSNPRSPSYGELGAIDLPVRVPWVITLVTVPGENIGVPMLNGYHHRKLG